LDAARADVEAMVARLASPVGGPLGDIQKAHPDTIIGSYPKYGDGKFWTELVVRARSQQALDAARADVEAMVARLASPAS
ncbi:MAG: competence/damage-inducible protein A, partial [Mesorhizobium sp.]